MEKIFESDMTLTAIIGIEEKIREELKDTVILCSQSQINMRIVTQECLETSKSIAVRMGLLTREQANAPGICMDASTFL